MNHNQSGGATSLNWIFDSMKKIFLTQLGLGFVVIMLSFGAQASGFYRWSHRRSEIMQMELVKSASEEQRSKTHEALWGMWHPPATELYWLPWIGLGIVGVSCFGLWRTRKDAKKVEPHS